MCHPGVYYSSWDQLDSFICCHALSWRRRQGEQDIVEPLRLETWAMTSPGAGRSQTGRHGTRPCPRWPHVQVALHTTSQNRPGTGWTSRGRKDRKVQNGGHCLARRGAAGPLLNQGQHSGHLEEQNRYGLGWGAGSWDPLHHLVPSLIPAAPSFPLPAAHLATSTWPPPGPRSTGSDASSLVEKECVYIQSGLLPTQSLPPRRRHM